MHRLPGILHVIPTLSSGGAERLIDTYLSNPALRDRFRHTIVLTDIDAVDEDSPKNFLAKSLRSQGFEIVRLGTPGSKHLFGCIRKLKRLIRERGVDLVHTHLGWANTAGQIAAWTEGKPVVTSYHSTEYAEIARLSFGVPFWKFDLIRRINGLVARRCMTRAVAVSRCVATHIHENLGIPREKIQVIYNPVDLEHIRPRHADPRQFVRSELGLPESARIVINVGRIISSKGQTELTEAFAEIAAAHPEAYLLIVGDQSTTDVVNRLRQRIGELGLERRVHLIPPRLELADWLAASDLFAFPTKYEGLGMALIEAMATGLPCVASDIDPVLEVIRHEETGLIVPLDDTKALSAAMLRLLEDKPLAERLGTYGKMHIRKNFDPRDKTMELIALYEDLLKTKSAES